ncbi:DUF695 domain-containing protein [Streptosporangium sp. KLBMP 9127]|nr:DUF695 domain-containing protein [Streptosporangium sp. KLBMP 9127]
MRLFGRKSEDADPQAAGIEEFWAWWKEARPELDALGEAGEAADPAGRIRPAVESINPALVCEVGPGRTARRALVVTAAGDPELRALAHRWARAAPPADAAWEFHPSRQADPRAGELTFDFDGYDVDVEHLVLGLRVPRGKPRVDVTAYHPIYTLLDEDARVEATLLALDRVLGEDEVARWVGEIAAAAFPPIDAVAAAFLPSVVADLASGFEGEQWALMEGQTAGGSRLIATVRYPLRPVDHPLFDQHIAIALPYAHADAEGLPAEASLKALRGFEERLASRLRLLEGSAVLAAHLSAESLRVMHLYADPTSETATQAKKLAASWKEGDPEVEIAADPTWSAVSPFLS